MKHLPCLVCALTAVCSAALIEPNVPDFYQHQKAPAAVNVEDDTKIDFFQAAAKPATVPSYDTTTTWWENGGGWCCVAALLDNFYYLEKQWTYTGFFTHDLTGIDKTLGIWQQQMIYSMEDFANKYIPGTITIPKYVRSLETASNLLGVHAPLLYSEYSLSGTDVVRVSDDGAGNLEAAVDVSSQFSSLFDVYRTAVCRGDAVSVRIMFPFSRVPVANPWWDVGFHVMAGAGVDSCVDPADRTFFVADPDKRNQLTGDNKTYLAGSVRSPYPTSNVVPRPVGAINYGTVTVDASGVITAYNTAPSYNGAMLVKIYDIQATPEPSTIVLAAAGLLAVAVLGRKRCR